MATAGNLMSLKAETYGTFPTNFVDTVPYDILAAVLLIDWHAGIEWKLDDYIALEVTFAEDILGLGVVTSPDLTAFSPTFLTTATVTSLIDSDITIPDGEIVNDTALKAMYVRMTKRTFTFRFSEGEYLHPIIRGKEFVMRLMTPIQSEQLLCGCATMRADGTAISIRSSMRS